MLLRLGLHLEEGQLSWTVDAVLLARRDLVVAFPVAYHFLAERYRALVVRVEVRRPVIIRQLA